MLVNRKLLLEALTELVDFPYQERVWAGHDADAMSSFAECIEALFDDSGLATGLSRGVVFGSSVDVQLRLLSTLVETIDAGQSVDDLLRDEVLVVCRHLAGDILRMLTEPMGSHE